MLASLTPREERVLRMRFGIGMNTDHTLEEVGQQFSVTRERIRQIEAKALRKLKHHHSDALEGPRSTSRPCLVPRPGGPHRDQDRLPKRARRVVREWVLERQMELMANWARGERREPFEQVPGADVE